MGRTSIPCSDETRDIVSKQKHKDETWDECLTRLAEGTRVADGGDEPNTEAVLDRLDGLESTLGKLDAGESNSATVNEIREAVRLEVQNQFEDLRH